MKNRDYKEPKNVYVIDFYSRQLEDININLCWAIFVLTLILLAIVWK